MALMHRTLNVSIGAALALAAGVAFAQKAETVKIAWIDPLSGLMAPVGQNQVKTFQFFADKFNTTPALNPAGVKFEVITLDNKLSSSESLNALQSAIDQGVHYIAQGDGSAVAMALTEAVAKNNERNPGKEVVYLNYSAVDPDLTNSKCEYWHFRFDANTSMKMEALTTFLKDQKDVKKVYIFGQNYSHGRQVSAYAKELLKQKRPDIEIVGDELHPLAQVRDFAPYIAKIKASGADTVITGNWGSDLSLLIKGAHDAGLDVKFYTYYANATGAPTALGPESAGKVFIVGYGHNAMPGATGKYADEFKAKFNDDWYTMDVYNVFAALSNAMAKAHSTDPVKVAAAMEGERFKGFAGEVEMRKSDHQMEQPLFISVWQKATPKTPYSVENTGYNFVPVKAIDAAAASTPTTCRMKRPA
jgi:branched-chain amino acid transport system substrate-binding protein